MKITTGNKIIFDGHVIAAESCVSFGGHELIAESYLFSTETAKSDPYFW
jgi:hypothetical protein